MFRVAFLAACLGLLAAAAQADPCTAVPDKGPTPAHLRPGKTFEGPVRHVGDGDSLCVALGPQRNDWVEVRLAGFYAPELREPRGPAAKAALIRIAKDRHAVCRAQHRSYDRVVARCTIDGRPIGELMRRAGVAEGGRGQAGAASVAASKTKSSRFGLSVARQ